MVSPRGGLRASPALAARSAAQSRSDWTISYWTNICYTTLTFDLTAASALLQDFQKVPVSSEPETSVQPGQERTHAGVRSSPRVEACQRLRYCVGVSRKCQNNRNYIKI